MPVRKLTNGRRPGNKLWGRRSLCTRLQVSSCPGECSNLAKETQQTTELRPPKCRPHALDPQLLESVGTWLPASPCTPSLLPPCLWSPPDLTAGLCLPANSLLIDTVCLNPNTNTEAPKSRLTLDMITKGDCILSLGLFHLRPLMCNPGQRQRDGDTVISQDSLQARDCRDCVVSGPCLRV